ncbi:nucleoside recognition GATE domain-containing membrane protein YjiH [Anaerosphaera aminiphila DSM 21120]|uniref:Nucleoside recognition GATE domain-containing membrane protein YjiH n=1 Tax=Anaerosphaera aminiphila DSM 21120 TaxID=1120995 RepID=A0A1M5U043_9FIRM|nr:YjiH family protein [Anaerosphaera aminiphila]SHH56402.1 nucleoside recognition GATE domain-containing membrane protein YjiH [Anaerosphaera aminiphila DSM 21120]
MSKEMSRSKALTRFVIYSLFGIFMFFVSFEFMGNKSIPLDHVVTLIRKIPYYNSVYGLVLVFVGVALPFIRGTWKSNKVKMFFSIINIFAIPFVIMAVFNIGPAGLLTDDMIPFIYNKVVVPVTTIVPVGSVFLAFIVSYGLMEFIGIFMRPVMVPIFKTPGRSAVDAVASFVGSYSLALLITNRVYVEGKYTGKEAAIIATGFSTVSAAFMIIVATTLGFMDHWTTYFWVALIVTFIVTAITARIYPLSKKPDEYYKGQKGDVEQDIEGSKWKAAIDVAAEVSANAPGVFENIKINFIDGFQLALNMAPSLMAIGTLGLIVAKYTPVFDIVGYIFYPFTLITRMPEPFLAAKAMSMSIVEMFLPTAPVVGAPLVTRFVVGVVCVSEILFFSASIPCILATEIPLKMKDYFIIWFERVALSILITAPIAFLLFG